MYDVWWTERMDQEPGEGPLDEHSKGCFRYVIWSRKVAADAYGYYVEVYAGEKWFAACPGDKTNFSKSREHAHAKGRLVGARFVDSLLAKYGDPFDPVQWRLDNNF